MEVITQTKKEPFPKVQETGKVVVLLSGGIDSTTLVYYMLNIGKEVFPISFYYGQKHNKEVDAALHTCKKLGIPLKIANIDILGKLAPSALTRSDIKVPYGSYDEESMKATVVPNRNMVFLSLATAYAIGIGASEVTYAAHSGDHAIYADCRPAFIESMRGAIQLCDDSEVYLRTPFEFLDKADILEAGIKLGVDYSLTWSCYEGGEKPCNRCGTCIERAEAFGKLGLVDPLLK